jgi:hypothetical protein
MHGQPRTNTMIKKNLLQLCVALCALQASAAMALTVWDNGGPSVGAGEGGSNMSDTRQAEDFTLTFASNLTAVRFWSLESSAADFLGTISYEIFNNAGGAPGATVFGSGNASVTRTAAGTAAGLNQFQNDFLLSVSNLAAGTYWIALHNGPLASTSPLDFYWSWTDLNAVNTPSSRGREFLLNPLDTAWRPNDQEHAFSVFGEQVPEIPEPETWMLLCVGLTALAWRSRRSAARKP